MNRKWKRNENRENGFSHDQKNSLMNRKEKISQNMNPDHPDIMTKRQMQWQPRTLYKWISGYPSC